MATPRRRSARLSKAAHQQRSSRKPPSNVQLDSLVERDETPDVGEAQSIDNVLATPSSSAAVRSQLSRLSGLKTPQTEPRPDPSEMHPELVHHSTARAPDSGLKFGFGDPPTQPPHSAASAQNTPSKITSKNRTADLSSLKFDFKFGSDSHLSSEAQQLMDNVREEAAKIKAQMQAEKETQRQKDDDAEAMFSGINASGRKIAQPKGRAGRFSDVHMAQFKKMDSIANHPSAYRAKPSFAQPTAQSLKRSGSRAGLDELDRPRTAGKGTPGRPPPPFLGRPTSVSPFKSISAQPQRTENTVSAKRARHSEYQDVSSSRPSEATQAAGSSTLPKPVSNSLLSPTKASLAKAAASQIPIASPMKGPVLKRTTSVKSLRNAPTPANTRPATAHGGATTQALSKVPRFGGSYLDKPLPAQPKAIGPSQPAQTASSESPTSRTEPSTLSGEQGFSSRLPKFSGLRSILRSVRKPDGSASPIGKREGTPKRQNSVTSANGSGKKVDFTPSVKSRYAVKLAAGSPSPAKLPQLTPGKATSPSIPYDPAAFVLQDDDVDDDNWEDAESEIEYPALPDTSSSPRQEEAETSFVKKAKDHNRRESKEFKSIFTTLHHPSRSAPPSTLTSVNTVVNKTSPSVHANKVMRSPGNVNFSNPSPSTIRRVRTSGVTEAVQPFEDTEVQTMPHGLPGKKRRRESSQAQDHDDDAEGEEGKENRRISVMPAVPGGWEETPQQPDEQDEGEKRGGKRVRMEAPPSAGKSQQQPKEEAKKPRPSMAREQAKNSAKERKNRGILSLSRLHMLSRPKQRG